MISQSHGSVLRSWFQSCARQRRRAWFERPHRQVLFDCMATQDGLWLLAFVLPRDTGALHAFCADFCEEAAGLTVARFWFLNVFRIVNFWMSSKQVFLKQRPGCGHCFGSCGIPPAMSTTCRRSWPKTSASTCIRLQKAR